MPALLAFANPLKTEMVIGGLKNNSPHLRPCIPEIKRRFQDCLKESNQIAAAIKATALANGAIQDFAIPNVLAEMQLRADDYNKKSFAGNNWQRIVFMTINCSIHWHPLCPWKKTQRSSFMFDKDRWRTLPGQTRDSLKNRFFA